MSEISTEGSVPQQDVRYDAPEFDPTAIQGLEEAVRSLYTAVMGPTHAEMATDLAGLYSGQIQEEGPSLTLVKDSDDNDREDLTFEAYRDAIVTALASMLQANGMTDTEIAGLLDGLKSAQSYASLNAAYTQVSEKIQSAIGINDRDKLDRIEDSIKAQAEMARLQGEMNDMADGLFGKGTKERKEYDEALDDAINGETEEERERGRRKAIDMATASAYDIIYDKAITSGYSPEAAHAAATQGAAAVGQTVADNIDAQANLTLEGGYNREQDNVKVVNNEATIVFPENLGAQSLSDNSFKIGYDEAIAVGATPEEANVAALQLATLTTSAIADKSAEREALLDAVQTAPEGTLGFDTLASVAKTLGATGVAVDTDPAAPKDHADAFTPPAQTPEPKQVALADTFLSMG